MMNADAQLEDVLQENEETHLYDEIMQLGNCSSRCGELQERNHLPTDPLALPAVVTAKRFKEAVIDYIKPQENAARLGTSCLVCSLPESVTVGYKLRALDDNPWDLSV
ncbi:unnamed protein product [Peronospora belbahrii]|uniref:Uncharacterized protein n=1 Tax=Peronospora belbahrii TaxID=622444 RepID=A0ABN8CP67_9STRA|nr:unnamed protein product [Peronospora belbahrii]